MIAQRNGVLFFCCIAMSLLTLAPSLLSAPPALAQGASSGSRDSGLPLAVDKVNSSATWGARAAKVKPVPASGAGQPSGMGSEGVQNPLFLPPVAYPLPEQGLGVAIGDLNGDGIPDLAALGMSTLTIMLGNGDGSFRAGPAVSLGPSDSSAIKIADLNGDGKADLVVTNLFYNGSTEGGVIVLLGNGDGTFQPAVEYDSGGLEARNVAVADVNGDGHLDLVTINCGSSGSNPCFTTGILGVLLGNGDGTFQPAVAYGSGGGDGAGIAIADLNNDGKLDLVAANALGSVAVLLGNGDGTFQLPAIYEVTGDAWNVAIADLNADGKLDVAATGVSILLGEGNGNFMAPMNYPGLGGYNMAITDVDGDGKPDLLVTQLNGNAEGLSVMLGNGDGTFQSPLPFATGGVAAWDVVVADLNGDGRMDAVVASLATSFSKKGKFLGPAVIGVLLNDDGPHTPTSTALVSNADPAAKNQVVTYTATVTGQGAGTVAGSITFEDGGNAVATIKLTNKQANFSTEYSRLGKHEMTAVYSGDTANSGSTSPAITEYIEKLPIATKTVVTTSGSPSMVGQPVTFTATVTASFGTIPDGELVTFEDGATPLGSVALSSGAAALTTSSLSAKRHNIKAKYLGDASFKASQGSVVQVVEK
jgi:Bacterial Ig-like domain (group 3)/FG-GAP-like repeat